MTQEQLAQFAGLSPTTISFTERAPTCATRKTLRAIADALGLELLQLCEALGLEIRGLR